MKPFGIFSFAILLLSCTQNPSLPGAYRLVSANFNTNGVDSTATYHQLKIYSGNYAIYTGYPASGAVFGVGHVVVGSDGVKEENIYTAQGSSEFVDPDSYYYRVEETETGYRQIMQGSETSGQRVPLDEEYERIDNGQTSSVDGAWHLTRGCIVKGSDTTNLRIVQYKFYHGGYFSFGHSLRDPVTWTAQTGIGYGTFEMKDGELTEMIQVSNYHATVGHSFTIHVSMPSTNEMIQVFEGQRGVQSVEYYERLVKGRRGGVETW